MLAQILCYVGIVVLAVIIYRWLCDEGFLGNEPWRQSLRPDDEDD